VGTDEGDNLRRGGEERVLPGQGGVGAGDVRQVGACAFSAVGDPSPGQHLVTGKPEPTAGASGGTAVCPGLLQHDRTQPSVRRGECRDHAGTAAADDDNIEFVLRYRHENRL